MLNRKNLKYINYLLAFSILCLPNFAIAEMNINADDQLEWHHKEQKVIAIGNAFVSKDDLSINADKITGKYIKDKNGKNQINKVIAEKNIKIKSGTSTAFGDHLDYDLDKDEMLLKGNPAKIKNESATITAEDGIKYTPSKNIAVAVGKVVAKEGENTIYSDHLTAYFSTDEKGKIDIDYIEIFSNLKIVSPNAIVTAEKGHYYPRKDKIELFNNVVIKQEENHLKGDYAETNLKTGVSKLISNKEKTGRVSGTFTPKNN